MTFLRFILLSILLTASQAKAASVDNKINQYLTDAESKGLTGFLSVVENEKTLISRGFGLADADKKTKNTATTVFDTGSNTKQFTAAAILKLVELGKLKESDPLSKFFSNISQAKSQVTVHQLLSHTAGFESSSGRDFTIISKAEFLSQVLNSPLVSSPGEKYHYSNVGYGVLAAIIEQVSGKRYEQFLREQFFNKLGMAATGYLLPQWSNFDIARGYHRGYHDIGTTLGRYQESGVSWHLLGNGGLLSTAVDMNKWLSALHRNQVLSQSSLTKLLRPVVEHSAGNDIYYGYGWVVKQVDNETVYVGHNGSNGVYWSTIYWIDAKKTAIVYWSNAEFEGVTHVASEVKNVVLDNEYQPKLVKPSIYLLVKAFIDQGKALNGLSTYLAKLEQKLNSGNVLNRLGFWYIDQGQAETALSLFQLNVQLFPSDGNLWDSLGEGYLAVNKKEDARNSFSKALALAPSSDCGWCSNAAKRLAELR